MAVIVQWRSQCYQDICLQKLYENFFGLPNATKQSICMQNGSNALYGATRHRRCQIFRLGLVSLQGRVQCKIGLAEERCSGELDLWCVQTRQKKPRHIYYCVWLSTCCTIILERTAQIPTNPTVASSGSQRKFSLRINHIPNKHFGTFLSYNLGWRK